MPSRAQGQMYLLGFCCLILLAGVLTTLHSNVGFLRTQGTQSPQLLAQPRAASRWISGLQEQQLSQSYRPSAWPSGKVMPHVDKCQSCEKCHIGELNHQKGIQGQKLLTGRRLSREQTPQIIVRPLQIDPPDRSNLPNCTECYGCQHELTSLNTELKAFNSTFRFDNGRTSAQIFKVKDPIQSYPEKPTVVKLWCVEVWNEGKGAVPKCKPHRANEAIQVMVEVQNIVDECGFRDIVANTWIEPVNGIIPGSGFHVRWDGLWLEQASGVSIDQFVNEGDPQLELNVVVDHLQNKMNKTQLQMGAIFDLLLCQGDRHGKNIFIDEVGQLTLIDNDESFNRTWRDMGQDSLLLPTTQWAMSHHVGIDYLRKVPGTQPSKYPDPAVLLDYRCHVPGGEIGVNYPPSVQKCLKKISGMTPEAVMQQYGMLALKDATMLHTRAVDMLEKGFEWALEFGEPRNPSPLRYGWGKPCCNLKVVNDGKNVECTDSGYEQDVQRPDGDPKYGDPDFFQYPEGHE